MPIVALVASILPSACGREPAPSMSPPGPACSEAFEVVPDDELWLDEAAASPAHPGGPWSTEAMAGPLPDLQRAVPGCRVVTRSAAWPFDEIVHCVTGDPKRALAPDNVPAHLLAVRTARGWWSHELARASWPHSAREEPQLVRTGELVAQDRLGDGGAEITARVEVGPPGGDKTRWVHICGAGADGTPRCARVRVAAGGPFHGAGALRYRLALACDGTLDLAGWQGGDAVQLVHGRYSLAFP
jgi:hypothetical protein